MREPIPTPEHRVPDAAPGNWVDRCAPPAARPYLRLSRADRPIGTWLLLIPCWWGLALAILHTSEPRIADLWIGIGCAIGAWLMRGAGCTWNDITDRDLDRQVSRTASRPIVSNQVSVQQALFWMVAQAAAAFLILLTFNKVAIVLGILSLFPVLIYPFAKRFTWWPQVFLGIAFNWGILLAWTAHAGELHFAALVLYASGICWTLFYDTIYAHQDANDDELIGIKSTARLFGNRSSIWLWRFVLATVALMIFSILLALLPADRWEFLALPLLGVLAMGTHLIWQLHRFDSHDITGLLHLFRSNRDAGLILVVFFCFAIFFR
ncbi:MAG: 4-hydroxybenzoate octaprenyltransferase [Aestuariivita sp.]|nr:4-hydroxybenzoate octaprenyltransferase [Aestuariivita sp.]MCY4346619.1 4-hydroxybenzoate octaprenyltransferase [Aestuariivita sp.]